MNEAELVAATANVIKTEGWSQGALYDQRGKTHCLLGAVGKARWGNQWDIDCINNSGQAYTKLTRDKSAYSVITRIARHLYDSWDDQIRTALALGETDTDEDPTGVIIAWNDDLLTRLHGQEELLAVLEKIQAEVGQP